MFKTYPKTLSKFVAADTKNKIYTLSVDFNSMKTKASK